MPTTARSASRDAGPDGTFTIRAEGATTELQSMAFTNLRTQITITLINNSPSAKSFKVENYVTSSRPPTVIRPP